MTGKIITRLAALAVVGLALSGVSAGLATAETAPVSSGTAVAIMQASAAMQAGKCGDAMPALTQLWDDASLQKSDPDLAAQFRFQRVVCTAQLQGIPAALALSEQNLHREPVTISNYDLHIFLQLSNSQTKEASQTLDAALTRFPKDAPQLTDISVIGVLALLYETEPARGQAILGRLEDVHWQMHDLTGRPAIDTLRLEALRATGASDPQHAAAYRADIARDTFIYVLSQGDGTVSAPATAPQDVRPVLAAQITEMKTYITQNPSDLSALSYLMTLENAAGQNELALKQLNGIVALIDQYGIAVFQNPESYATLLSQKAGLLADLGRTDEALAAYKDGETRLNGGGDFDFYHDELDFLIDSGHDKEAQVLADRFDMTKLDETQKSTMAGSLACLKAYTGDKAGYAASLAGVTGPSLDVIKPMLCAGDADGAAKAVVALIKTPAQRDYMIPFLQNRVPAVARGPRDVILINALTALRKRSDVLEAASAANILIRDWPIKF